MRDTTSEATAVLCRQGAIGGAWDPRAGGACSNGGTGGGGWEEPEEPEGSQDAESVWTPAGHGGWRRASASGGRASGTASGRALAGGHHAVDTWI